MKISFPCLIFIVSLALLAASGRGVVAAPLGTTFTYQGRLTDGSGAATGLYDFSFTLWNALGGPSQLGPTLTPVAVPVSNGLFTVTLDFGNAFDGNARWLDIAVKTNGAVSYTPLTPRQPLTPSPYALFAPAAGVAASATTATTAGTATVANSVANLAVGTVGLQDGAVTAAKIGGGNVVKTLNSLKDDVTLSPGANVTLTPSGQTLTLASPTDWHVGGNAATTPGTDFLGTLDGQPLEMRVNNQRRFLMDTNGNLTVGSGNIIQTGGNTWGATIGGGYLNTIQAANTLSTIAGGQQNVIQGGGWTCTIGGGGANTIKSNGFFATIPGGYYNTAAGNYSFAAGNHANATNSGTFVWSDAQAGDFGSTSVNQFLIRAGGGVGINKNNPATALDVNGTITASLFSGSGAGLTGIPTTALADNSVTLAKLADNSVGSAELISDSASLAKVTAGRATVNGNRIVLPSVGAIDTSMFSGLAFQYDSAYGEGAIMSSFNNGMAYLSFYTKPGTGSPVTKQMIIDRFGGVAIDQSNANNGVINDGTTNGAALTFGTGSGEGIASKRTADGNQYGLDFYTGYTPRMSITRNGSVGIGTNAPTDAMLDVEGAIRINDDNLYLRAGSDRNHGIGYRSTWDGPFVYGFEGGALGTSGPDMPALSWNWSGNVWVSNNLSSVSLNVRGGTLAVDNAGLNNGTVSGGISFGAGATGEGISSKRTGGGNQNGLDFYTASTARLSILNNGNVGIGTSVTSGYKLYVSGPAYSTGGWASSDARWKKNVQPVTGALDKITQLQGVTYDWRRDEFPDKNFDDGSQLGFLAQDVEKVVPEAVRTDADGYKAVAYEKLTTVLTEGVKEQQAEIEALKTRNAALEKNVAELKKLVLTLAAKVNGGTQ